ncbi:glycosyltransferase family 25 protein [Estrella lausannensis]|uniref:Glycosyltransferase n=1 Tax=Estrella lausannensis TaxID=483423 RepID=A0A0H5E4T5_9BACT|nr:glycosyltransferase family 25 protein [Estrella lausannensis]CRX38260.1 Glycosyltransferase [Estrella lausannensis]
MNILMIFFCLLISPAIVCADVIDYLKPAPNKEGVHSIRNIDFIYMINLDRRPEKFARSAGQLNTYGVFPYRFSAVNGWELTYETLNKLGIKYEPGMKQGIWGTCYFAENNGTPHHEVMHVPGRNYFSHCMSRGAIGIVLSHLSILKDALDSGYETIWVMEDDVEVIQNPNKMSDLIDKLDALVGNKKWDILFTDQDTKNKHGDYIPCLGYALRPNYDPQNPERFATRENVSHEFKKIGARYGAYSMIVRRSGMQKILSFINTYKVFLPYDMEFYLPKSIRMYAVREDVVSTFIDAQSDNGAPNYSKK